MSFLLWLCFALHGVNAYVNRPHIILFFTDNLKWNDVGFRGSTEIRTPHIDALVHTGLTLENHYATPLCAPSRSALMTGKYPINTDMQHDSEPKNLPLEEKYLPQHLNDLGYTGHLIGKWRLGSLTKKPLSHGFDTDLGSWTEETEIIGDVNTENEYERAVFEKYATDVYTAEAVERIKNHDKTKPMFLMVANYVDSNDVIRQEHNYGAIMSELDRSVGAVFSALHENGLLNNSIILFSTDNGGPAVDVKNTLWEGGIRGSAVLWSPLIEKKIRVATQRIHNADWLPTLISAAGGDISALGNIDGIDQWEALSKNHKSTRNAIVQNIDDNATHNLLSSHDEILALRGITNINLNITSKSLNYEPLVTSCPSALEDRILVNEGIWLSGSQQFF